MEKILIIDDDEDMCLLLTHYLIHEGFSVTHVHSGAQALDYLQLVSPDVIISDLKLGDIDGFELFNKIKDKGNIIPVILITAYHDDSIAEQAKKNGLFKYITKPILPEQILVNIREALTENKNQGRKLSADKEDTATNRYFLGETTTLRRLNSQIDLVADTDYNVIISGEKGSGKEVVAREIHARSRRRQMPFVIFDANQLNEDDTEDNITKELINYLSSANKGAIFIENLPSLSVNTQKTLLKMLRDKKAKDPETKKTIELDVRVFTSTPESLWNYIIKGRLQEELFHFLNNFHIELLPLRLRKPDILFFADHFLQIGNKKTGKKIKGFTLEAEDILRNYSWPGNLHDLSNVINKALLLEKSNFININTLTPEVFQPETFSLLPVKTVIH